MTRRACKRLAEDRRDCYWLHVATNWADEPQLQEPIADPARFPWHELGKVQHYWLQVDSMIRPMKIREERARCGGKDESPPSPTKGDT